MVHEPQVPVLVWRFQQLLPPQETSPAGQFTHALFRHTWLDGQPRPQPPQWSRSKRGSVQCPSHSSCPAGQRWHAPLTRLKPALHTNPHAPWSHVAVALSGAVQGAHRVPHVATALLLTHAPLHSWVPAAHANPHAAPSHVADAPAGTVHGVQRVPQVAGLRLSTHAPSHGW